MTGGDEGLIDWPQVMELRDEIGPEEFADVVALFLSETEAMTDALAGVAPGDLEAELHALKGASLNLGFARLAALCAEGERAAASGRAEEVAIAPILSVFARSRAAFCQGLPTHAVT